MSSVLVPSKDFNNKSEINLSDIILDKRIIFICGEINDELSRDVVSKLLYLDSINHNDITIYINSGGGSVSSGFAIYDTMRYIESDIRTVCIGNCCSMASVLLSAGTKGKRSILEHSYVMIHQPSSGFEGKAIDFVSHAKHVDEIKNIIINIYVDNCGCDIDLVKNNIERDCYMNAFEAKSFGIVDRIVA